MHSNKEALKAYKRKQIESSKPVELIVLLYNGALDFLTKAENKYDSENPETIEPFHKNMLAAQNIITELTIALDMENGGDVAQKLFQLYDYMNYRLVDINISKNIEGIKEVKELLQTLKEGWEKLSIEENKKNTKVLSEEGKGINIKG